MQQEHERRSLRSTLQVVGVVLMVLAVVKELRRPAEERRWHGELAGTIPYDLRPPTPSRVRAAWWNPGDDRLFTPRAFGVGWAVNLARVRRMFARR